MQNPIRKSVEKLWYMAVKYMSHKKAYLSKKDCLIVSQFNIYKQWNNSIENAFLPYETCRSIAV